MNDTLAGTVPLTPDPITFRLHLARPGDITPAPLKTFTLVLAALLLLVCSVFNGCLLDTKLSTPVGYVSLQPDLLQTAHALGKRSVGDTTFTLDSLLITLSAPGAATQRFSYALSGRPDTGAIAVSAKTYGLSPLRTWTARIMTIDTSLNPGKRDTVHLDSVTFNVKAGDTTAVSFNVSPVYSILRVRFVSTLSDSIPYGIRYIRLRVDGVVRDSVALEGVRNNRIFFASTSVGYAVGDSGRLRTSTDGGTVWRRLASGVSTDLNTAWFTSITTGWIAGANGVIRKTTNSGGSWTTQSTGSTLAFKNIVFKDANTGILHGDSGALYKTVDGGTNWISVSGEWSVLPSGTTSPLSGAYFSDVKTGWVVGASGTIRKTTDGGWTWTSQNTGTQQYNSVSFSGTTGYLTGNGGVIYRTTNGTSWSSQSSGVTSTLNAIYWNGTRGWVVGASGVIRYTTNGTSWSSRTSGTTTALYGVHFIGTNPGWVVGASGTIRKTAVANNNTWTAQTSGTTQQLNGVYFVSANTGWTVGNAGTILHTTNGGTNWGSQTSGTTQNLTSVRFVDATNGYAAGAGGTVLKTTNGGSTWALQPSGTSSALNGIHVVNAGTAFTVGAGGTFLKTRNGGLRWTTTSLNGAFYRTDTGYVVGDGGVALRTLDGGDSWTSLSTSTTQNLNAVFSSGTAVIIAGNGGVIRTMTHDGTSTSFTTRTSNTTRNLNALWGSPTVGATRFYAGGDSGELRSVTAITQSWAALTSKTTADILSLHCNGTGNACWMSGDNSAILATTNGTTWVDKTAGAKTFDQPLAYKYLRPGIAHTIILGAIDRPDLPLRGYQGTVTLTLGAAKDSTLDIPLVRCGYGGATPACVP